MEQPTWLPAVAFPIVIAPSTLRLAEHGGFCGQPLLGGFTEVRDTPAEITIAPRFDPIAEPLNHSIDIVV